MNFRKTNTLSGWAIFLFALIVYTLTREATGSFWDCGEFISSCYKLQIPHPPGAPLFVILGRVFIILFGDDPQSAGRAVNFMSALMSALTILFLFWSITHFARKLLQTKSTALSRQQVFTIISAGAIGALAYAFCDSFWYSAVEGEVYASSAFFTALVFWAMLKWENHAEEPRADRWLLFIFLMMGLSIGVHLLNLLTIPALVMIYYFRRYQPKARGIFLAFIIGCLLTGLVQKVVIQYSIKGAAWFDIFFVNSLRLPFFSGFAFFFVLITALIVLGIRFAVRRQIYFLKLGLWGFAFMLLGYSTYFTTMIRSNADPAIDMFNVDNPVSLVGYLSREQYGDWPLLYGPDFTDAPPRVATGDLYVKGARQYDIAGKTFQQDWSATPSSHFFPRMWNSTNDRGEQDCYRQFSGLAEGDKPGFAENVKYFIRYQAGWMYFRYFMWNFVGKQNDLQGFGNVRDSNWISGIPFIDNALYGNQQKLPDSIRGDNKSFNRMYFLPLLLGLAGMLFQYKKNKKDFLVNGLLFFFTGIAIVIYLNQAGYQPRERDYAYAGSFYVFALWIGLGVLAITQWLQKVLKQGVAPYAATAICLLAVPVLMGVQEWDDHDRHQKTLARDLAKDYLESCPPNAILISSEDNDTYPLWYAQEVEGIRPDVRIVITTLLGSDWYMNQLRYKINQSAPADIIFTPEQIEGSKREVLVYSPNFQGYDQNKYYDLYSTLKNIVGSDESRFTMQTEDGDTYQLLPYRKFSVPVNGPAALASGIAKKEDHLVDSLQLDLSSHNYILKNDLAVLAIVAANHWNRPICFTNDQAATGIGLAKYLRTTGMIQQLVPVENSKTNLQDGYQTIMTKFAYGNAGLKGVYYDEENRRRLNLIKSAHIQLAISLAQSGQQQKASEILRHFDQQVAAENFPYGMTSNRGNQHDNISASFLQACYLSGDTALAQKVAASLRKDLQQQLAYYQSLGDPMTDEQLAGSAYQILQGKGNNLPDRQAVFAFDIVSSFQILQQINAWEKQSKNLKLPPLP